VNTDDKQLRAIAALLDGCGYEGAVHLMPYNGMAKTKWEKIGRGGEYINYGSISEADIERAVMAFESSGYRVYVNR
jgi:pyruvate-formate lyase-activating enzyme